MKKKILSLLFLLLSIFGFSLKADAAPATIKTTSLGKSSNLISGVPTVYVKQTTNSIYLYCEEALKKYPANMTIRLRGEAPKGMVYILKISLIQVMHILTTILCKLQFGGIEIFGLELVI